MEMRDSQQAFKDAITAGHFNEQTACDYMYMYSDAHFDYFKHIITRQYHRVDRT